MDQQDHNKEPPKRDQQDHNKETPKKDQEDEEETKEPSWISLIDEEQKQDPFTPIYDEPPRASTPKTCACAERPRPIPLVEHLCKRFNCSAHELHVLFRNLEKRRDIVEHLRSAQLRTAHLRPFVRNFPVRCNDLSILDAHSAPAYRGFLGITVRMHYYIKHGIRLHHPNLPCVVEFGGGDHKTFFPLEILTIIFWLLHNVELIQNIIHVVSTQSSCESDMEQKLWLHSYFNRHVSSSLEFHTLIKPKSLQQGFYDEFNARNAEQ
ncbi:hypothetical protein niasHT_030303 [Heterodera trifolii]|uniref:Uncharacterized protein n=1 Tax=Heterodera trifolii TaxID=157864 RepID=A0ABD2KNP2_9BILA